MPFKEITSHMSADSYPTLAKVIPLYEVLTKHSEATSTKRGLSDLIKNGASECLRILNKYYVRKTHIHTFSTVQLA